MRVLIKVRIISSPAASVMKIALLFFLMGLCGCGSEGGPAQQSAEPANKSSSAPQPSFQSAIFVATGSLVPECTQVLSGQIAYFEAEAAFKYCAGTSWDIVDLKGPKGDGGLPGGTGPVMVSSLAEPAGANCFYGGRKYSIGADADASGTLDSAEITGSFNHCESSISSIASDVFSKYVYSIGLVEAIYRYTGTCYGVFKTHESSATGTAWAFSSDTFVTNAHVARSTLSEDCNGDGVNETQFTLAEIKLFLPKTSIPISTWRSSSPLYSATNSNQTDYDVFSVTQVDRRPSEATAPSLPQDIADAMFLKVVGHGRTSLPVSTTQQDAPTSQSIRIGEELFIIGHPQGRSPTMSVGSLMSTQSCAEWYVTDSSFIGAFMTEGEFCRRYSSVPASRRMILSNYSDHGLSGGPVFNRFGEVVGIETWGSLADEQADFSAVQQIAYVRPWLQMTRVWSGLSVAAWQDVSVTARSYKQTLTGKEWTKIQETYTWTDAVTRCGDPTNKWGTGVKAGTINASPGYNGKTDWRMPTLGELRTAFSGTISYLDSAGYSASTVPAAVAPSPLSNSIKSITDGGFLNGYSWSSWFWSGATDLDTTSKALEMSFNSGSLYSWGKTSTDTAICVRGP